MNTEKGGKIKGHNGFYGAIKVIYEPVLVSYSFLQKQQFDDEPVHLEMLAVRKDERSILDDLMGRFFKKHNIIDYKSPDNAFSINAYKAQGYACIYKSVRRVNERRGKELTVSTFRHTYPLNAAQEESIIIGEARNNERVRQEERHGIRDMLIIVGMRSQCLLDRLVAGGMETQEVANFIGLSI